MCTQKEWVRKEIVLMKMLDIGFDFHAKSAYGMCSLFFTLRFKLERVALHCIELGADVECREDANNDSPLM